MSEYNSVIKDSGNRTEFSSGAVRDMHEDKGRCDLMPLDVIADGLKSDILGYIAEFVETGDRTRLYNALGAFANGRGFADVSTQLLETAKHFEQGAKKYGEYNWQKGIPVKSYIDSAVRHYLKWVRGDMDEPHDRAFCWNILCCIWTCKHKPELNDYRKDDGNADN